MSGIKVDVCGMFSAISNINTEKASNTVKPNVTFSPLSGDNQNTSKVKDDSMIHGIITLYV